MLKEYNKTVTVFHRIIDNILILLAWYLAYLFRFYVLPDAQIGLFEQFSYYAVFISIVSFYIFEKYELYLSFRLRSIFYELSAVSKAVTVVFTILILALYFFQFEKVSRIHLLMFYFLSLLFLNISRLIKSNALKLIRQNGKNLRYVTIFGNNSQSHSLREKISKLKSSGLVVTENKEIADALIVGFQNSESEKLNNFLKEHYNDVKPLYLLPDLNYSLVGQKLDTFDGMTLINLNQPSFSTIELILKRCIDLLASTVGLVFISPLLIIISTLVKISSPGPIFYGQERVGLDGKKFKMWKFRSMRLATSNEDKTVWTSKGDPRITKIGSFIRKTSIDELPQLFNILFGDMSLVGPRPERTEFVEKFKNEIPNYMLRHKMKAGLTGWAQVNGWRGDTDLVSRIECDIFYIKNWSIWLDIKIILLTFIKGFVNKNAY